MAWDKIIRQYGGLYPALMGVQESEIRLLAAQLEYAHENRGSSPSQYPSVVGILDQGVRAEYSNGEGGNSKNSRFAEEPYAAI